jgi:hypothetical protein
MARWFHLSWVGGMIWNGSLIFIWSLVGFFQRVLMPTGVAGNEWSFSWSPFVLRERCGPPGSQSFRYPLRYYKGKAFQWTKQSKLMTSSFFPKHLNRLPFPWAIRWVGKLKGLRVDHISAGRLGNGIHYRRVVIHTFLQHAAQCY